jgi:hypothetical protein
MKRLPKPRKKSVASLHRQILACKAKIAAERDKLRELVSEIDEIGDHCEEAVHDLERAADTLSQYL